MSVQTTKRDNRGLATKLVLAISVISGVAAGLTMPDEIPPPNDVTRLILSLIVPSLILLAGALSSEAVGARLTETKRGDGRYRNYPAGLGAVMPFVIMALVLIVR